jgi:putative oxidoreductase
MSRLVFALGRILVPIIFIVSGWGKLLDIKGVVAQLQSKNFPIPPEFDTTPYLSMPTLEALAYLVAVVELFGGVMILVGWKARWAALALLVFSALTTYYFHNFWVMEGADRAMNQIEALKNLSIMGALLMIAAVGSGAVALDRTKPPPD